MKIAGFLLILFYLCSGCSYIGNLFPSDVTQYLVYKEEGQQIRPVAKIKYRVFTEKQEVVYWVEYVGKDRSSLYKLGNCVVVNKENWEGDPDYSSPVISISRVQCVNGKITDPNSVNWWQWHFETEPPPSKVRELSVWVIIALVVLGFFVRSWLKDL